MAVLEFQFESTSYTKSKPGTCCVPLLAADYSSPMEKWTSFARTTDSSAAANERSSPFQPSSSRVPAACQNKGRIGRFRLIGYDRSRNPKVDLFSHNRLEGLIDNEHGPELPKEFRGTQASPGSYRVTKKCFR